MSPQPSRTCETVHVTFHPFNSFPHFMFAPPRHLKVEQWWSGVFAPLRHLRHLFIGGKVVVEHVTPPPAVEQHPANPP